MVGTNWLVLTGLTKIRYPPTTVLTGMLSGHLVPNAPGLLTIALLTVKIC